MVSMKPGSGTKGLGLDYEDRNPQQLRNEGVDLLTNKLEDALLGRGGDAGNRILGKLVDKLGFDPKTIIEVMGVDELPLPLLLLVLFYHCSY